MKMNSGFFRKKNISCHNHIFYRIGDSADSKFFGFFPGIHCPMSYHVFIFAMGKHRNSCFFCFFHRFTVNFGIHHGLAIFANCFCSCFYHTGNIRHFLAKLPFRNSPDRINMNRTVCFGNLKNFFNHCRRICHRLCIWHRTNRSKTALCHRVRTGINCFLVLKTGFS